MSQKTADTLNNGAVAQGDALADAFVETVKSHGNALMRFMKDLFDLSLDGRKAFRVKIEHILKEQRAYVASFKDKPEHEHLSKTFASFQVRMSEAVTVSKAYDAGYNPVWETDSTGKWAASSNGKWHGYHSLIGEARVFLSSGASGGPTMKRGRKATPALEKAVNYIAKLGLTDEELAKLAELIQESTKHEDALL